MLFKDDFCQYLKDKGRAKETIREYRSTLNMFERYLVEKKLDDERKITKTIILEFFKTFINPGMASEYQRKQTMQIVFYFKYLEDAQKIFLSPLKDFVPPECCRYSYPTLNEEEIRTILDKIEIHKTVHIQGVAIIELMYSSALRPREVYGLRLTDIDFNNKVLFIEQSKGRKDRIVPVGEKALSWLTRYIKEVRPLYLKDSKNDYVFINERTGKPLSGRRMRYAMQQTLKANRIESIKPYSLRSTAATSLLINGMPVAYIGNLLGHSHLRTTQVYLKIRMQELEKILSTRHPRNINNKAIAE